MSVYEGLYQEYVLTYAGSGPVTYDEAEKPVESGGPLSVRAWFEPTAAPQIIRMVGADENSVAVEGGLLGDAWPDELVTGAEVDVLIGEKPYKLTLIVRPPSAFALIDELEGPRFYGKLRGPVA